MKVTARANRVFRLCAALVALTALLVGTFALAKCGVEYAREANSGGMKRLEVPCDRWPALAEAERTLAENAELVGRLESLSSPNTVELRINAWQCPGKASFDIWIPGVRQRDAIYEMLGSDAWFFGVPYQLINW